VALGCTPQKPSHDQAESEAKDQSDDQLQARWRLTTRDTVLLQYIGEPMRRRTAALIIPLQHRKAPLQQPGRSLERGSSVISHPSHRHHCPARCTAHSTNVRFRAMSTRDRTKGYRRLAASFRAQAAASREYDLQQQMLHLANEYERVAARGRMGLRRQSANVCCRVNRRSGMSGPGGRISRTSGAAKRKAASANDPIIRDTLLATANEFDIAALESDPSPPPSYSHQG
jgi:hypothetical protein